MGVWKVFRHFPLDFSRLIKINYFQLNNVNEILLSVYQMVMFSGSPSIASQRSKKQTTKKVEADCAGEGSDKGMADILRRTFLLFRKAESLFCDI